MPVTNSTARMHSLTNTTADTTTKISSDMLNGAPESTSQPVSSHFLNGSLPASLTSKNTNTSALMYYQTATRLKSFFSIPHHFAYASPVNLSFRAATDPVPYGISFSSFNQSLAIHNSTLIGSGATASTTYAISSSSNPAFVFNSQGSGGTFWSNFTIDSFTGQRLLNPFRSDLFFNTSFSFLKKLIPNDGIRYSFYIDFKFDVNSSLVSYSFPAIIRLHLFYSSYYSNFTLYPVPGCPALSYYLGSNSIIDVVLNQSLLNSTQNLFIDFSRLMNQVVSDYHQTSFIPYFNSFKTVEIGFFSTNSTSIRSTTISFSQFNLYNSLLPANWFVLTGTAGSPTSQQSFSYPVSAQFISLHNITFLDLKIALDAGLSIDPTLFYDKNFLVLAVNTSVLTTSSFHLASVSSQSLLWQSSINFFPLQFTDYLLLNPSVLFHSQLLFWYCNQHWHNVSIPTTNNKEFFPVTSVDSSKAITALTGYHWFGGSLANDFSKTNFSVSFQSSNYLSPFSIRGSIIDDLLSLNFTSAENFNFTSFAMLFANVSSSLVFLQILSGSGPDLTQLSFTSPIQTVSNQSSEFVLVAFATSPVLSVLYQSFSVTDLIASYNSSFLCSDQISLASPPVNSTISMSLHCSFDSHVLSQSYINQVLISVLTLNSSSLFKFTTTNISAGLLFFKTSIFIPLSVLTSTTNISLAYNVTYLSSFGDQLKWHNATYIIFNPFTTSSLPQQSDLNRYVPFYAFFSLVILSLIVYRKKRISKALHDQVS